MNAQVKTPRKVTVTPADPKYAEAGKDIRKRHLRVAPYCRVSTGSEEQLTSFTAQMDYYTQRIADTEGWSMVKMYADKGITGTSAKKRPEFLKMIRDAEKGKIDLVITKSVSRFTRNTLDGLEYVRRLKRCGVGVYFEKENTNTLNMSNEMILTFMMSQAQSESESLSTNVKWGFRKRFQDGVVYYHYDSFLGYQEGPDGQPEIDPDQAPVVRRIFARYLMGHSVARICRDLTADGIPTARGGERWCDTTVRNILQNEKYIGDAILQKTFSADLFDDRQQIKNEGQLPKYYVHDCHPAIIDRDTFQRVQEEIARRSSLRKTSSKTKTEQGKYSSKYAFGELLVCSECGSPYLYAPWPEAVRLAVHQPAGARHEGVPMLRYYGGAGAPSRRGCRHERAIPAADGLAGADGLRDRRPGRHRERRPLPPRGGGQIESPSGVPDGAAPDGGGDADNTEFDEEISRVSAAILDLLTRKTELEREGRTDPEYDSRVASITDTLEGADSVAVPFDDVIVRQVVSSIKVMDRDRVSIRFKDGTEVEQVIEYPQRRVSA